MTADQPGTLHAAAALLDAEEAAGIPAARTHVVGLVAAHSNAELAAEALRRWLSPIELAEVVILLAPDIDGPE